MSSGRRCGWVIPLGAHDAPAREPAAAGPGSVRPRLRRGSGDQEASSGGAAIDLALSFPEGWQDEPWEGDIVVKVRKKVFVFAGAEPEDARWPVGLGLKLPVSKDEALALPGAAPSGYGLGKWGWVSISLEGEPIDPELIRDWIEESYRAVAPKTLAAQLEASRVLIRADGQWLNRGIHPDSPQPPSAYPCGVGVTHPHCRRRVVRDHGPVTGKKPRTSKVEPPTLGSPTPRTSKPGWPGTGPIRPGCGCGSPRSARASSR